MLYIVDLPPQSLSHVVSVCATSESRDIHLEVDIISDSSGQFFPLRI